jgi:hypothetical protein
VIAAALVAALLLGSAFVPGASGPALASAAAAGALAVAGRAAGRRAVVEALLAALLPCAAAALLATGGERIRLAAFPLAAAGLEVAAVTRLVGARSALVEAWLCAGARPLEVLPRVRGRARPAILVALALVAPVLGRPGDRVPAALLAALAGIGVAHVLASVAATLRIFVDQRLVDRAPAEARAPFRLRPYEAPPPPRVYETRPGREAPRRP